jgi:hypothetical protein
MEKLFFGILAIVCFNADALPTPPMVANVGAVQARCSSSEISEQASVTCELKNNGSASVDGVQTHVFMVVDKEKRCAADDRFAITGIGSCINVGSTYELLVRLIDTDGLPENQEFIIVITIGDEVIELPLQLSNNNK